jgi:TrmH family RNA methyltransferase
MYHKFIAEGEKILREAIMECPDLIEMIVIQEGLPPIKDLRFPDHIPVYYLKQPEFDKISQLTNTPGILCIIRMPDWNQALSLKKRWLIYLDGIRDPGNLGTILRTADWFGFQTILLSSDSVEWSNPKVIQSAMGSIFRTTCFYGTLEEFITQRPGIKVFAADMNGTDITSFQPPDEGILVLGSESRGISAATKLLSTPITITKNSRSRAESLNVAIAAGILFSKIQNSLLQ